jgi:hypothetical protein
MFFAEPQQKSSGSQSWCKEITSTFLATKSPNCFGKLDVQQADKVQAWSEKKPKNEMSWLAEA